MRLFLSIMILLSIQVFANDLNTCKSCHPTIYSEFQKSYHKRSTIAEDKVHQAVWNKHPAKAKGNYKCAKCHTPESTQERAEHGVTCISCHTIMSVEEHTQSNKNIYETKDKTFYSAQKGMEDTKIVYQKRSSWFGMLKKTVGSPYHDIDYTHENFYTGKVCMGCHSHKQNKKNFNVCQTDISEVQNKESNCITCHMPQVKGSSTSIKQTATHAFHGFAGVRNAPELLAKYIDISYQKSESGFTITIENKAPHKLLTHPLRVVQLQTALYRNGKKEPLKTETFVKVIGTEGKPSMPWLATEVLEDNMIKGEEKRVVSFDIRLKSGDKIESTLGYYIVNPKVSKKLGLEQEKELIKFTSFKKMYFTIE